MILKTEIMRPAVAMLELIFAIVIMGIILMSAPMLISTAAKSGYVAIQQEAINEAASQVNMIMGYQWDENDVQEEYIDPILQVSSDGHDDLDEKGSTGRRQGTPEESYRTFVRSDGVDNLPASTSLSSETGEIEEDDIDDFSGVTNLVEIQLSDVNYIETTTIDINTSIAYNTDNPVSGGYNQSSIGFTPFNTNGNPTNIKEITATLTSSSTAEELNKKKIILRAFSCNIGAYKLEEKDVN